MKIINEIGYADCSSCGAMCFDVALYEEEQQYEDIRRRCCRMCAHKMPWQYGAYGEQTRVLMETIIYTANVIRWDMKK